MLALIDGDEAIYKASVIKVEATDWADESDWATSDATASDGASAERFPTFEEAKDALLRLIESWEELAGSTGYLFCLSPIDRKLFRRGIYDGYKAARAGVSKPPAYKELEQWCHENLKCRWFPGLEADDVMGVLQTDQTIIVSSDKDMKTVPGLLVNPGKRTRGIITPTRADWQWMYQTLMGDSTDGFNGCLGCGPKGAEELLNECPSILDMAWAANERFCQPKKGKYKDVVQTTADFRQQAVLARILRPEDFDQSTGDIRYSIPGFKPVSFNAYDKQA